MMRFHKPIYCFLLVTLFACAGPQHVAQTPSSRAAGLDADEIAVMAVVLDAAYAHSAPGWVMLASRTATFECNPPSNIGLDVGDCNGMRVAPETAEERLGMVHREIPSVTAELSADLIKKNQQSSILFGPLPIPVQQVMYAPGTKTDLKYDGNPTFAAYFSRVGFDATRAKAIVYLGTINWTDRSKSMGQYLYLEREEGAWKIMGHAIVWAF